MAPGDPGRYLCSERDCFFQHRILGDHPFDEPDPLRFRCVHPSRGKKQVRGPPRTDETGECHAQREARMDAEPNEIDLEPPAGTCDAEIAGEREPEPGADGTSLHGGHGGHRSLEYAERLRVERGGGGGKGVASGGIGCDVRAEVGTRAERTALGRDDSGTATARCCF